MRYDRIISSILNEDELPGGLADGKSVQSIAKKHGVSTDSIKSQLKMGTKVEYEHTKDKDKAREIAMDHLDECPTYYTRLKKMEGGCEVEEMVAADAGVGSTAATGSGIAPQDNIKYAEGDTRIPKVLGARKKKDKDEKKKKKQEKVPIQRRNLSGM